MPTDLLLVFTGSWFFDVREYSVPVSATPSRKVDFQIVDNKCWHIVAETGFFS